MTNPNQEHIDEFRANDGQLGGYLTGAPMLLLHHVGAMPPFADYVESSGRVIPVVVLERI
jgi:hypothetical protein